VPYDSLWGDERKNQKLPSYIISIKKNEAIQIGNQSNLLYIGKKKRL